MDFWLFFQLWTANLKWLADLKTLFLLQLANIVAGYSALVKSLNEELVTELINKDELTAQQDSMLETISELTDSLLWEMIVNWQFIMTDISELTTSIHADILVS